MKRLSFILLISFMSSCVTKPPYVSSDFRTLVSFHKKIAILPVQIHSRISNLRLDSDLQRNLFIALAKRVERGQSSISIQNYQETSRILKSSNISEKIIKDIDKAALCKLLGVDAVMLSEGFFRKHKFNDVKVSMQSSIYDYHKGGLIWRKELTMESIVRAETADKLINIIITDMAKLLPY
ncbi:MAG: hypothetical protein NXI00_11870 [Cytophagales bacterium]|nr:hypothetical protein [Cytophagales bacterium]